MKTIRVLISPKGEVTVDTQGFAGPSCREASRFIEEALGARTSETVKPEFHQVDVVHEQLHHRAS